MASPILPSLKVVAFVDETTTHNPNMTLAPIHAIYEKNTVWFQEHMERMRALQQYREECRFKAMQKSKFANEDLSEHPHRKPRGKS